jgi:hypothetical protein
MPGKKRSRNPEGRHLTSTKVHAMASGCRGRTGDYGKNKFPYSIGRRSVLGAAAAALSAGALGSGTALGQTSAEIAKGERNYPATNPGPINKVLEGLSKSSLDRKGHYVSPQERIVPARAGR